MGMSPQSGLPQNNRVGDFDPFALPRDHGAHRQVAARGARGAWPIRAACWAERRERRLSRHQEAAAAGNARARLALDVFIASVRHYLGAYLVELGGADAIVFTGGIGENGAALRTGVCRDLEELGIVLDPAANETASGEVPIHARQSRVQIWVMPTNEELIVARQAAQTVVEGITKPC